MRSFTFLSAQLKFSRNFLSISQLGLQIERKFGLGNCIKAPPFRTLNTTLENLNHFQCFDSLGFLENLHTFSGKGPFIIYDRGWAGKIQLTTKQNVLPHPLHHKKIQ